MKENCML